ncbi:MAG: hypothetical protein OEY04_13805 [Gammaproteobacteria bacterium]|nr:hypothetical protein [Gammaproteobacteria bacterium]
MRLLKIALGCLFLGACGGPEDAPEEQLRQWLATAQAAAESRDRSALMEMLSPGYTDARGNDREAVDKMLRYYFLRQDKVVLVSKISDIAVRDGTAAEITLTVAMGGSGNGALGFSADAYHFELELEHNDDEWLLMAARWGELGQKIR